MLKVLWLCSWYPNNIFPFEGNFIQRHAQAASLFNQIHVIKLTPDPDAKNVTKITKTYQQWPNLTETFVYYPKPKSFVGKTVSYLRWYSLYKYAIENYIEKNGKPDLVHVHIPFKSGLMAKYIKRKYNIPYVVTEHWYGYSNLVENNYRQRESWFRRIVKDTLRNSLGLHVVSKYLGNQINNVVLKVPFIVIPNVVNTNYFDANNLPNTTGKFRLVHISNGDDVKNVSLIIEVFKQLDCSKFHLTIIGLPKNQSDIYKKLGDFKIDFIDQCSYREVAEHINHSDCLVMFSKVETFSCVIAEALCCGIPVISSNVGAVSELINKTNGILVDSGNVIQLHKSIIQLRTDYESFDTTKISTDAKNRFSYEQVAKDTTNWYHDIMFSTVNNTET